MKLKIFNYPCPSCGAVLLFKPATGVLECDFCKTEKPIEAATPKKHPYSDVKNIKEFHTDPQELACTKCGASFSRPSYILADLCPYCKTPALSKQNNPISIDGLIPFKISHKEAQKLFKKWVGSLWFAPTAFTKYLEGDNKLEALYTPHWNFDTDTTTHYSGQRGDAYYVMVNKHVRDKNGGTRVVQVRERRIRWSPVRGVVHASFSEVTTPASEFVDKQIVEKLSPWDHSELEGFSHEFLSGLSAQEYTTPVSFGFRDMEQKIAPAIRQKIRYDIGGDEQRIESLSTHYSNTLFQNNLYPVWRATFVWNKKEYDYAVNGQNGKVSGERPYSIVKIAFAVASVVAIIAVLYYISQIPEVQEYLSQFQ